MRSSSSTVCQWRNERLPVSPVMSTEQGIHNTVEAEARTLGQCGRQPLIGLENRKASAAWNHMIWDT